MEYRVEAITIFDEKHSHEAVELLNQLGSQGWEAISAWYENNLPNSYVMLKRSVTK
jgi:hypothetical protein